MFPCNFDEEPALASCCTAPRSDVFFRVGPRSVILAARPRSVLLDVCLICIGFRILGAGTSLQCVGFGSEVADAVLLCVGPPSVMVANIALLRVGFRSEVTDAVFLCVGPRGVVVADVNLLCSGSR